jgi:elongation factor 1-beta
VALKGQIKMTDVVITLKIMPSSPDDDLSEITKKAKEMIANADGEVHKVEEVPIAFGLKSINIMFIRDEDKGSTDELENQISKLGNVNSVEVIDVRRTIG